jgi:hypothetical protein
VRVKGRGKSLLTGLTVPAAVAALLAAGAGPAGGAVSDSAAAGSGAGGGVVPARVATPAAADAGGIPAASAGPTMTATTKLALRRFVAAGTRAYVVGAEDGTFPPIGWHITGQMGRVWAPPVKLLDGVWFGIGGNWLDNATSYTSGPGMVRLTFPATNGLTPTLTEFAPDGLPTALFGLTLVPTDGKATTASVVADAHSQVAAAYPWSGTTPTFDQFNNPNSVSASSDVLTFNQQQTSWYAKVGASPSPAKISTGPGFWGPTPADQQATFGSKGQGGELSWSLPVPAGGRTLWLGVAGSQDGAAQAAQALRSGLTNPEHLLAAKVAGRDAAAAQTDVSVPDSSIQQALLWSKLNLADLRRTVTNVAIRDTKAGTVYPAPLAHFRSLTGIDAAYPDYAEFFGTDGAYSTYGLATSGQWQTAMDHLNTLRQVSQAVNGGTGKVVHEITSTGAVYYGDNSEPGDINETAQFDIAAGLVWQWSGDNRFLHQNYAFIKAGLHYLLGLDQGNLWPAGAGIVENNSLGNDAIDVASETVQALGVLHSMAAAVGDQATAAWAAQQQQARLKAFGQWWIASQHLYADSMCTGTEGDSCTHAGQLLQQRWWTSVAPMEQDVAPPANASAALDQIEGPTFTGSCGLYVDGVGGPSGTGGQTCYLVNTGALAVSEANYGRLPQTVTDMGKVASQLTSEMPGSLPELAASAQYDPFEAFTSRANVMQAWSGYGLLWTTVHDLLGVVPDVPQHSVAVVPEVPASWPKLSVRDLRVGHDSLAETASHSAANSGGSTYQTVVSGAQGLSLTIGAVVPAGSSVASVTLDGHQVHYQQQTGNRGLAVTVTDPHPGASDTLTVTLKG